MSLYTYLSICIYTYIYIYAEIPVVLFTGSYADGPATFAREVLLCDVSVSSSLGTVARTSILAVGDTYDKQEIRKSELHIDFT